MKESKCSNTPHRILHVVTTNLLFLAIFIFHHTSLVQQNLSETEKLAAIGKVWGFLKYYHPKVADGKYNWDAQLFEMIPKVKNAKSKEELSQTFVDWLDGLGEVKKCKNCSEKEEIKYFEKNFDLKWMKNENIFTNELTEKLEFIESNRHQGIKHYVSTANKKVGNIEVTNEIIYKEFDWQDDNFRLLCLFR